jgi:hypothetical protein
MDCQCQIKNILDYKEASEVRSLLRRSNAKGCSERGKLATIKISSGHEECPFFCSYGSMQYCFNSQKIAAFLSEAQSD